jgi:hypothetical protein
MSKQPEKRAETSAGSATFGAIVSCAFICATIAFIAYLLLTPPAPPARRLWLPVVVETNGAQTVLGETRQMEFWTPSVNTKDYLRKYNGEVDALEQWQVIPSDDAVVKFGSVLHSNQNVFGYRREEVWGQGRTSFKPGWWWTMNVTTNFSVEDLSRIYRDYWKSQRPLMIEVIDNRGINEN